MCQNRYNILGIYTWQQEIKITIFLNVPSIVLYLKILHLYKELVNKKALYVCVYVCKIERETKAIVKKDYVQSFQILHYELQNNK